MFKTHYNFEFNKTQHCEKQEDNKSLTVPDMSYTVREMMEKFTTGGMPDVQRLGDYDENASFEDAVELDQDLVDVMIGRQNILELKEKLRDEQAKESNKKRKEYSQWLKAKQEAKDETTMDDVTIPDNNEANV